MALLEKLTASLWEFQLRAIEVMYYHQSGTGNRDLYDDAVKKYEEDSASRLGAIRIELSKFLRLAPTRIYDQYAYLYHCELLELDACLDLLIRGRIADPKDFVRRDDQCTGKFRGIEHCSCPGLHRHAVHG